MRDLPALERRASRSSTRAASARSPVSSTATPTRRAAATASTSSRCAPPARATRSCTRRGGGILSTVRATRALGEDGLRDRVARHAAWLLRHGTTTWEGKSGYGLDRDTELASLRAVAAAGGSPTWLGAHAVPPEQPTPTRTSTSRSPRCCRKRRRSRRPPTSSSNAARSTRRRRAGTSTACREAGLELRLHGDQFTESGAIPLARELGARSVDHLEATGAAGVRELAAQRRRRRAPARERALPRPADAAGPGARRRRRGRRARDRLQSRQLVHDEPAADLLARLHAAQAVARRGALGGHGQRGARARVRADRVGRLAPG